MRQYASGYVIRLKFRDGTAGEIDNRLNSFETLLDLETKNSKSIEGAQFVRYFGPLLDALRKLGGSGTPGEVVEQVAEDLKLSEDVQSELLESCALRFPNQLAWARFYLSRRRLEPH